MLSKYGGKLKCRREEYARNQDNSSPSRSRRASVVAEGKTLTPDLGGKSKTAEVANAIAELI